jgi:alcohol dehydrogenase (cytochrome c)
MFIAAPGNVVHALDAATGDQIWEYRRELDDARRRAAQTRNLAIFDDLILLATVDAHVVALDVTTGHPRWDVAVGRPGSGFTFTSGPIIADGVVVAGLTGCSRYDEDTCYIVGLDARDGTERWRTSTIARPGERGDESLGNIPLTFRAGGDACRRPCAGHLQAPAAHPGTLTQATWASASSRRRMAMPVTNSTLA